MDSLSQLALGASLGIAVLGRRTAVWKAALWGGIAGTLPDLDVLINHGDPLSNMVTDSKPNEEWKLYQCKTCEMWILATNYK